MEGLNHQIMSIMAFIFVAVLATLAVLAFPDVGVGQSLGLSLLWIVTFGAGFAGSIMYILKSFGKYL